MFIILPYSHDLAARRLPVITYGLIALNIVVFLITHYLMPGQTRDYEKQMLDLEASGTELLIAHSSTGGDPFGGLFELPELQNRAFDMEAKLEYIREKLAPMEEDSTREWVAEYDAWKAARANLAVMRVGMIPARQPSAGLLTHMFVHAGWLHILFNMWFLYLAGTALEDRWGRPMFAGFYLLAGLAAAFTHIALHAQSETPVVGASGAVAGLMGAFALRFAREKIDCVFVGWMLIKPVVRLFRAPAWGLLALWLAVQIFSALMYSGIGEEGNVAFWAHIGGFAFGLAWAAAFKLGRVEEAVIEPALMKRPEFETFEQDEDLVAAMDMMGREQFAGALERVERVLGRAPGNADARLIRAHALMGLKRREDGRAEFLTLMDAARGRADRDGLVTLYSEYRSYFPDQFPPAETLYAVGRALFDRGDADNADHVFQMLGQNAGEGGDGAGGDLAARALFYRARVRAELRGDAAGARIYAEKLLAVAPDHAWAARAREMLAK